MLKDIINRNLVSVDRGAGVLELCKRMDEYNVGCVLVVDDGKPVGIVTDRDIVVRCLAKESELNDTFAEDLMTESPVCCHENDGVYDCIAKMRDARVRRMPVVDDNGRAIGIISFGDLLAVLSKELAELTRTTTIAEEVEERAA